MSDYVSRFERRERWMANITLGSIVAAIVVVVAFPLYLIFFAHDVPDTHALACAKRNGDWIAVDSVERLVPVPAGKIMLLQTRWVPVYGCLHKLPDGLYRIDTL